MNMVQSGVPENGWLKLAVSNLVTFWEYRPGILGVQGMVRKDVLEKIKREFVKLDQLKSDVRSKFCPSSLLSQGTEYYM